MPINSASYALPPIKRAARRIAITFGATIAAIGGLVLFFYVKDRLTPQHTVIVENGNAFPIEVAIADDHLTIAAGQHTMIRAHDGALQATVTGPGGFSESVSLELPDTSGLGGYGRTALYNVGGVSSLAVVSATYGLTAKAPPVRLLDRASKLMLLPAGVTGDLDAAFPDELTTRGAGTTLTHVCHADVEHRKLGCPNA